MHTNLEMEVTGFRPDIGLGTANRGGKVPFGDLVEVFLYFATNYLCNLRPHFLQGNSVLFSDLLFSLLLKG